MLYFTPGPSELYPTVPAHLQEAINLKIGAISHRGKTFQEFYGKAVSGLKTLLQLPESYEVLFLSSATEIWERALQNCVSDCSFHLVNGAFSQKFYEFSSQLGLKALQQKVPDGSGFTAEEIEIPAAAELVAITHNETSTGVSTTSETIAKLRKQAPEALFFVDAVSSLPYPGFDYNLIDSVYFSVQKCFGLPAGLGVWLVNKRVIAKAEALQKSGKNIGTYHALPAMLKMARQNQTPETPNVLGIYLFSKVVADFLEKSIATIRKETDEKAASIYSFLEESPNFSPAVTDQVFRSQTTIVANTKIPASEINKRLEQYYMQVGTGYGDAKDSQIRIANFPAHSPEQMAELLTALRKVTS